MAAETGNIDRRIQTMDSTATRSQRRQPMTVVIVAQRSSDNAGLQRDALKAGIRWKFVASAQAE
jgi:hypothetical protein